jgi:hypothetical protein
MASDISRLVARIRDAGIAADAWPEALRSLTDALGVAGAACIISNKRTRRVQWVCFSGLSAEFQSDYVNHYASLDPFMPLLNNAPGWNRLSECLPERLLRRSEWYNDFVLACGVRDAVGIRLVDTPSYAAHFGLHQQVGRSFSDRAMLTMNSVTQPLIAATLRHAEHLFSSAQDAADTNSVVDGTRFYFHVTNGRQYPDETGKVFSTHREAKAHAAELAAELGQDRGWGGFLIAVTDEAGSVIARIPVPA